MENLTSKNLNIFFKKFKEPLSVINNKDNLYPGSYNMDECIKDYPTSPKLNMKIMNNINFKRRIQKILWYKYKEQSYDAIGIVKINSDLFYFYMNASCCYTGFEVYGTIYLYFNEDLNNLINYAIPECTRKLINNK